MCAKYVCRSPAPHLHFHNSDSFYHFIFPLFLFFLSFLLFFTTTRERHIRPSLLPDSIYCQTPRLPTMAEKYSISKPNFANPPKPAQTHIHPALKAALSLLNSSNDRTRQLALRALPLIRWALKHGKIDELADLTQALMNAENEIEELRQAVLHAENTILQSYCPQHTVPLHVFEKHLEQFLREKRFI